jgi:hypothetical protein
LPPPYAEPSGADGPEDGIEGIGTGQPGGIDGCAYVSFGIGGPFGAIAVGGHCQEDVAGASAGC